MGGKYEKKDTHTAVLWYVLIEAVDKVDIVGVSGVLEGDP